MENNSVGASKSRGGSSYPKKLTKACKSSEVIKEKVEHEAEEDVGDVFEAEELASDEAALARGSGMISIIAEVIFCKYNRWL